MCPYYLADATPGVVWDDAPVTSEGGEGAAAGRATRPGTRQSLAADLAALGLRSGSTVLVHSSLSELGWVAGGSVAVVQSLLDVLGPDGTLVVPTQTGANSEPSEWARPPVHEDWWQVIRAETPGYDPLLTPSRGMGQVAEQVRTWPGAQRSAHPQSSFAALGARAAEVVAVHELEDSLGERSPLRTLEDMGASVLFVGTGWGTCTALHLAEYRVPGAARVTSGAAVLTADGGRAWVEFADVDLDEGRFPAIGADFEQDHPELIVRGTVGTAACLLFPLADAVAYAVPWLVAHAGDAVGPDQA